MQLPVFVIGSTMILGLIGHTEARPSLEKEEGKYLKRKSKMPSGCEDKKFCDIPHDKIMQNIIDKLLRQTKIVLDDPGRTADRDGFETRSCGIEQSLTSPMRVFNIFDKDGTLRYLAQSQSLNVSQEFDIEECSKPDTITINNNNNKLLCQQVTMDYSYLVLKLDATGFERVTSKYPFPVYCDELLMAEVNY